MEESKTVKVTIARGTVRTGGFNKETGAFETTDHGPGAEIEVTEREAAGLVARGQVVDPQAEAAVFGEGPNFEPVAGPTVTEKPASRARGKK